MKITSVETPYEGAETLKLYAVCGNAETQHEDNSYAGATPCAILNITIQNPDLLGKFKTGDTFYVDFTPVPDLKEIITEVANVTN